MLCSATSKPLYWSAVHAHTSMHTHKDTCWEMCAYSKMLHWNITINILKTFSFVSPSLSFFPYSSLSFLLLPFTVSVRTRDTKYQSFMRYEKLFVYEYVFECWHLGGELWEITHYFIVLLHGGKALLKLSLLPFTSLPLCNSLLPSPSRHQFRLHIFLASSLSASYFFPLTSHLLPSLSLFQPIFQFSPLSCIFPPRIFITHPVSFRRLEESRGRKQLGSQTMEHIKIKKHHQPYQLHTQKHSKTNRTFQLPAAPDSSPWLIWNREWDWEWSRAVKPGENCMRESREDGKWEGQTEDEDEKLILRIRTKVSLLILQVKKKRFICMAQKWSYFCQGFKRKYVC